MGSIIQPLKRFARKSRLAPAPADVAHAVANALFLYHLRLREEAVTVVNRCVPGEAIAWCDPNRLEQVLTNLIGNAIDAMVDAPVKVLTLEALAHDAAGPEGQSQVRIDVVDTGCGFGDEDGGAAVRAVLHHQGQRLGPRPRPDDLARHRARVPRRARGRRAAGRRRALHRDPAR